MYKIALIHTVQSVLATFGDKIKSVIKDVKIVNTLDEFLASDPAEKGEFTINNANRLFSIIKCAEMTEVDAIVITCSTLSPIAEQIRPFISVPVITIDEPMLQEAVSIGTNITILATAQSTIDPTISKLSSEAEKSKKHINITSYVCDEAYTAIKSGDKNHHDEIVKRKALEIKEQDVVILAQASMGHLRETIEKICGCPVLSSPELCIDKLKEVLEENRG